MSMSLKKKILRNIEQNNKQRRREEAEKERFNRLKTKQEIICEFEKNLKDCSERYESYSGHTVSSNVFSMNKEYVIETASMLGFECTFSVQNNYGSAIYMFRVSEEKIEKKTEAQRILEKYLKEIKRAGRKRKKELLSEFKSIKEKMEKEKYSYERDLKNHIYIIVDSNQTIKCDFEREIVYEYFSKNHDIYFVECIGNKWKFMIS